MLIVSLVAAIVATSTPTYLRCTFPDSKIDLFIAADEANGVVTVTSPATGRTQRLAAGFAANVVTFHNSVLNYEISRTDLTIRRSVDQMNDPETGTCKVEEAPKRAF